MDLETTLSPSERTQYLERLLEISRSLSASLDLEPFLHSLIAAASELTGCETASILELEEGGELLHFLALPWFHRDSLKAVKVPMQTSVAGWVLENGQPAVIPDVSAEPLHFKGADLATDFVTHSLMAVPITFQGEKLGVLEVVNKDRRSPLYRRGPYNSRDSGLPGGNCHPEHASLGQSEEVAGRNWPSSTT